MFAALADPTRRQLVDWLAEEGSGTATGFANRLPMTRQAVARHLQELELAEIVASEKSGRETRFTLQFSRRKPLPHGRGSVRHGAFRRTLLLERRGHHLGEVKQVARDIRGERIQCFNGSANCSGHGAGTSGGDLWLGEQDPDPFCSHLPL